MAPPKNFIVIALFMGTVAWVGLLFLVPRACLGQAYLTTNRNLLTADEAAGMRTTSTVKFYYQGKLEEAYESAQREAGYSTNNWHAQWEMANIQRREGNLDKALEHFHASLADLRAKGRWSETNLGGVKNYTRQDLGIMENIKRVCETQGKMGLATRMRFEILKTMDEAAEEMVAPEKLNCVDCALIFGRFEMRYRATHLRHSKVCPEACEIYQRIGAYAETNRNHQLTRDAWSRWASHLSDFEFFSEAIQLREKLEPLPFDRRSIAYAEIYTLELARILAVRDGVTSNTWSLVDGALGRLARAPNQDELLEGNLTKAGLLVQEGRSAESLKLLEQIIETARAKGYQPHLAEALEKRASIRLAGEGMSGAEADVKESLAIYRTLGQKESEPGLYELYAKLLGRQRQCERATRTWEEAFVLCENLQLHFRALHMLLGLAELQTQCGQFVALDSTWQRIENFAASHQSDLAAPTLLRLHLARLEYLKQKGLASELAAADRAARTFVAGSGLSAYQLRQFEIWTNAFPGLISSLQPHPPIVTLAARRPELDLQPVLQKTKVRTDEIARGHFVVSNPSSEPALVTLRVDSQPFQCAWSTNGHGLLLALSAGQTNGDNHQEHQIEVAPGQQVLLTAQCGPVFQATNYNLALELMGGKQQPVRWDFEFGEDARTLAVVNASLAEDNPFYSLSFFHEVYFRGQQEQRTNLRVQTSEPCRVEIFDALSQELLAVDANGDGDFADAGDNITTDLDLNVYPDFVTSTATDVCRFELVVFPQFKQNRSPREIEITLSFGMPGSWTPQAVDRLALQ